MTMVDQTTPPIYNSIKALQFKALLVLSQDIGGMMGLLEVASTTFPGADPVCQEQRSHQVAPGSQGQLLMDLLEVASN